MWLGLKVFICNAIVRQDMLGVDASPYKVTLEFLECFVLNLSDAFTGATIKVCYFLEGRPVAVSCSVG